MIEQLVALFFGYFSVVMLVAAVVMAAVTSRISRRVPGGTFVDRLYRWTLLLSVGVQGVYTFVGHVFFPEYAAREIGWAVSPFQFEAYSTDSWMLLQL